MAALSLHAIVLAWALVGAQMPPPLSAPDEALLDAAQRNDMNGVVQALEQGADVNSKKFYGGRALLFAATNANLDMAELLVERGADLMVEVTPYLSGVVGGVMRSGNMEMTIYLLENLEGGSAGISAVVLYAVNQKNLALLEAAFARTDIPDTVIAASHAYAVRTDKIEMAAVLETEMDRRPGAADLVVALPRVALEVFAGSYLDLSSGQTQRLTFNIAEEDDDLTVSITGATREVSLMLVATSDSTFITPQVANASFRFERQNDVVESVVFSNPTNGKNPTLTYLRADDEAETLAAASLPNADPIDLSRVPRDTPRPWPSFRGRSASGIADGQGAVVEWDAGTGRNIRWKTPIPGIANASPIIWGNRVFVATAVSSSGNSFFRTGDYSGASSVDDLSEHSWRLYALDVESGRIVWEREVHQGVPRTKRHMKGSQASSTPATDGRYVVVMFGTVGMFAAYDINGELLWKNDLGVLDNGSYYDSNDQWGHSSSPIIYGDTVILQIDRQRDSFVAAYDLATGRELWLTGREGEISSWGTPTIVTTRSGGDELITNGTSIRGYDPKTGELRWTLSPNSDLAIPTPVAGPDFVYVAAGYPPVRPIYAIRPGSSGNISLEGRATSNEAIAWSTRRGGPYIPTPIFYRGVLYILRNNGVITGYDGGTGERVYQARVGRVGGAFTASPIAADGRLYLVNEDGDAYVLQAGREYALIARNDMNEIVMATPAISDGLIVIRTFDHVYGIGDTSDRRRK
jgi:outer membrane protein assembly factor BamB